MDKSFCLSKVALRLMLALTGAVTGCAHGPEIVTVTDPEAKKASYGTIAFAGEQDPPVGFKRKPLAPRTRELIVETVSDAIINRLGYQTAPLDQADLVLRAGVGRMTEKVRPTTEDSTRVNGIIDYWLLYERKIETGTLVFDVFERESNRHVWHGQLKGTVESEIDPDKLRAALVRLFETFPRASRSGG